MQGIAEGLRSRQNQRSHQSSGSEGRLLSHVLYSSSSSQSIMSPGLHLSALHSPSRVENLIPFSLPVLILDMFTGEIPTNSANSTELIFRSAITRSNLITIGTTCSLLTTRRKSKNIICFFLQNSSIFKYCREYEKYHSYRYCAYVEHRFNGLKHDTVIHNRRKAN